MEWACEIDHTLYPRKALAEARQTYASYCDFRVRPKNETRAELTIIVKPEYTGDAREVLLEFLNYLLDRAAELQFELDRRPA